MHQLGIAGLMGLAVLFTAPPLLSQSSPSNYRDEFMEHFERSSRKIMSLARVMPQELYEWSPGEGVMSVARVYMHIARYNFYYLESSLGISAPSDVDVPNLESITDKATVERLLERSVVHVREAVTAMTSKQIEQGTMLYGRDVASWAVLFQLLAHMNEHVGQSIAYARMNDVVPPWSR